MRYCGVHRLQAVIRALRNLDDTLPLQTMACFLEVVQHDEDGPTIGELASKLNLAASSASRNVAALSKWHWQKRPGLGLVDTVEDRMNLRKKGSSGFCVGDVDDPG
ncbi:MAG TPA: hypothetical protein VLA99_10250 [Nitrospiraceae bacterium]|nr:hypothetical protein [Nitrospiraceae bacterium]